VVVNVVVVNVAQLVVTVKIVSRPARTASADAIVLDALGKAVVPKY
jgi:hypothetical protein